ncbi:MAG: ImmA/IrrE family metallo-endopeptidase [Thermoguttaceae bacterium]|nr:ImmA/IrrE family metallo-endopeptidase [Thermoguttaceae bacterium]
MDIKDISQKIQVYCKDRKITQSILSQKTELSISLIKKVLSGKCPLDISVIQKIASAIEVPLEDLFIPFRLPKRVRYRSNKEPKASRILMLDEIGCWLENYEFIEELLGIQHKSWLNIKASSPREYAQKCREYLKISPSAPIYNISELFEVLGVKLYQIRIERDSFCGASVFDKKGQPAIVCNSYEKISIERQLFTAAHELGHLLMHLASFEADETAENKKEEKEANAFASYFLMPNELFIKYWKQYCSLGFAKSVLTVKSIFGVSYLTVLYRLSEFVNSDQQQAFRRFLFQFRSEYESQYGDLESKKEPFGIEPYGNSKFIFIENRLRRLVFEAVSKELISISRAAEILMVPLGTAKEEINSLKKDNFFE